MQREKVYEARPTQEQEIIAYIRKYGKINRKEPRKALNRFGRPYRYIEYSLSYWPAEEWERILTRGIINTGERVTE